MFAKNGEMQQTDLLNRKSLSILYTDYVSVGTWWNFQDVISPFNRLYLVTDGYAAVHIRGQRMELSAGDLFLIPKFTFHSYTCEQRMTHYYICFTDEIVGGRSLFQSSALQLKQRATDLDYLLMQRFFQLNPDRKLPSVDPKVYDNQKNLFKCKEVFPETNPVKELESNGILLQLFSRFITAESLSGVERTHSCEKMDTVIQYIHQHLGERIFVTDLATLACLTPDHFSKVFKRVMGLPPCEYILEKRIQRAQTLLLTSDLSISAIADKVGIPDLSQFSRLFTRLLYCSPREYRKRLLL